MLEMNPFLIIYKEKKEVNCTKCKFFYVYSIQMWNKSRKRTKDYWSCIVTYFKELGQNKFFIVYLCHQEKKSFRGQNWSFCWYNLQNTYPFQNVSIDEMVIPHIGRWKCKQYNPKKHQRITWQCEICVMVQLAVVAMLLHI